MNPLNNYYFQWVKFEKNETSIELSGANVCIHFLGHPLFFSLPAGKNAQKDYFEAGIFPKPYLLKHLP